ncbi:MAG: homogentisate phytyltransferase [Cyanobacteria bacterium P01_G01_bin.54]
MTTQSFPPAPPGLLSLWRFARPHTIIGTSLSVIALAVIAMTSGTAQSAITQETQVLPSRLMLPSLVFLGSWLACLAGNLYIVGLNQLTDIEIDRINKPNLPLVSGALTVRQGQIIVAGAGVSAIALSLLLGPWLLATVLASLVLGTVYSLPPFRLKRWPLLAAFCILVVRGGVINGGLALHFTQVFTGQAQLDATIGLLIAFIVVFSIAIALFKDMPDTDGDRAHNIATFVLQLGPEAIFQIVRGLLIACYVGMIGTGWYQLVPMNRVVMLGGHTLLLVVLCWRSQRVELGDRIAIQRFYQFIWRLFFLEYILFPIACWPWPST